ncbi:MAG TPA: hypothetical protein VG435_18960, partial [Acidimicrobiales bacterium]|nr:hypothetical protein [Acidimicrobiales bacterium]
MAPSRATLKAIGMATQMFLRTLSKVVGGAVVQDAVAFFAAFEGMEQGFRERAKLVSDLLADERTAFVVVAAPRRDAVAEAIFFADRLRDTTGRVEALIANRMFPSFGPVPAALATSRSSGAGADAGAGSGRGTDAGSASGAHAGSGTGTASASGAHANRGTGTASAGSAHSAGRDQLAALAQTMADFDQVSTREEAHLTHLTERLPETPVVRVPFLASDVHDLDGLGQVGHWLFAD